MCEVLNQKIDGINEKVQEEIDVLEDYLKRLEKAGYKLFNSIESIKNCDDKVLTCLKLKEHNLPIPETIIAPFTFENIPYNRFEFVDRVAYQQLPQ